MMTIEEMNQLKNGLYIIMWQAHQGGGFSLASLGRDSAGAPWIAPTNWISGSTDLEEEIDKIEKMLLVMDRTDVLRKICPHKNTYFLNSEVVCCHDCGAQWQE